MRRPTGNDFKVAAADTVKAVAIVAVFAAFIFSQAGMRLLGHEAMPPTERIVRAAILLTAIGFSSLVGNILIRCLKGEQA